MRWSPTVFAIIGMAASSLAQEANPRRSVDEIIQLRGKEYILAFQQFAGFLPAPSQSFDDLARLLENFPLPDGNQTGERQPQYDFELRRVFEVACERGGRNGIDRLARIFAQLPVSNYTRQEMLFALAEPWLERELDAITIHPAPTLEFAPQKTPLPERVQAMPEELQAAVQLKEMVCDPYEAWKRSGKDDPYIAFQKNEDAFWKTAGAFLAGDTVEAPRLLRQFKWDSWCGTGSEMLGNPKSILSLMVLLQQRRLPEALGAALEIPDTGQLGKPLWPERDCRRRLFEYCGLDWEAIYIGGLAADPFGFLAFGPLAARVAASGSPRGVHLLVASLPFIEPSNTKPINALVAALGSAPKRPRKAAPEDIEQPLFVVSSEPPPPARLTPLPSEVQDEVINALSAWAGPDRESYQLNEVTKVLARFICPPATEALGRLAAHPDQEIAAAAIEALRERGAEVPEYQPVPPVRFALQIAGHPVARAKIDCAVESTSGGWMNTISTDAQGHFELPAKALGHSDRKNLRLSLTSERYPHAPRSLTDPAFQTVLPLPLPAAEVIPVNIRAQPLILLISYPRALPAYAGKNVALILSPLDRQEGLFAFLTPAEYSAPLESRLEFPAVQEGRYQLQVKVPGAARWNLATLVIADRPQTVEVKLAPGSDVQGQISGGSADLFGLRCELRQDGHTLDPYVGFIARNGFSFHGVPVGRYVVHIPSSAEKQGPAGRNPREVVLQDQPQWGAIDLPFEVTAASPAMIDLGQVKLPATK